MKRPLLCSLIILVLAGPLPAVNDFTKDPNCVGRHKFEGSHWWEDSSGQGNHVWQTTSAPAFMSADKKEGAGCVDFKASSANQFRLAEARQSSDFPCRNGAGFELAGVVRPYESIENHLERSGSR